MSVITQDQFFYPVANDVREARTNRIGTTHHPSAGDCDVVNRVDHPTERRASTGSTGGVRGAWNRLVNRPAY